jgi:hypothetical protein
MPLLIYSRETSSLKIIILLYYIFVTVCLIREVGFRYRGVGYPYCWKSLRHSLPSAKNSLQEDLISLPTVRREFAASYCGSDKKLR